MRSLKKISDLKIDQYLPVADKVYLFIKQVHKGHFLKNYEV